MGIVVSEHNTKEGKEWFSFFYLSIRHIYQSQDVNMLITRQ